MENELERGSEKRRRRKGKWWGEEKSEMEGEKVRRRGEKVGKGLGENSSLIILYHF